MTAKAAVVCARGLGDGLLSMILAHNLTLSGYDVTTFSSILCQLQSWFPDKKIEPFPQDKQILSTFDQLIVADHSGIQEGLVLKESSFDKQKTMVENLANVCRYRLKLRYCTQENGITPPAELKYKAHPKRVIIHPTSSDEKKNWLPERFETLCKQLTLLGYEPTICVSPDERSNWPQTPHFPTVADLAAYIYESGFMIGNDSGVGHLASCLGIPTLSLFARKSYSHLWRPGWSEGQVVTPSNLLIGSHLKQKYWKQMLSVNRTLSHFKKIG